MNDSDMPVSSIVYGPVPSWRLGRSLGIDLVSTKRKTCSFDCIYCQLGRTVHHLTERREFVSLSQLRAELEAVKGVEADYVTFSGVGEPTLASNLGQAISMSKVLLGMPVAVLTNSSLIPREDVQRDLAAADVVVAKVDAPDEETFHRVNRPVPGYCLDEVLRGIELFKRSYEGRLALQMMFVAANRSAAAEMARIARRLSPDEVQLNTPLRPCATKPLSRHEMAGIKREFVGLRVVEVYEAQKVEVRALDAVETLRRRPQV